MSIVYSRFSKVSMKERAASIAMAKAIGRQTTAFWHGYLEASPAVGRRVRNQFLVSEVSSPAVRSVIRDET